MRALREHLQEQQQDVTDNDVVDYVTTSFVFLAESNTALMSHYLPSPPDDLGSAIKRFRQRFQILLDLAADAASSRQQSQAQQSQASGMSEGQHDLDDDSQSTQEEVEAATVEARGRASRFRKMIDRRRCLSSQA